MQVKMGAKTRAKMTKYTVSYNFTMNLLYLKIYCIKYYDIFILYEVFQFYTLDVGKKYFDDNWPLTVQYLASERLMKHA